MSAYADYRDGGGASPSNDVLDKGVEQASEKEVMEPAPPNAAEEAKKWFANKGMLGEIFLAFSGDVAKKKCSWGEEVAIVRKTKPPLVLISYPQALGDRYGVSAPDILAALRENSWLENDPENPIREIWPSTEIGKAVAIKGKASVHLLALLSEYEETSGKPLESRKNKHEPKPKAKNKQKRNKERPKETLDDGKAPVKSAPLVVIPKNPSVVVVDEKSAEKLKDPSKKPKHSDDSSDLSILGDKAITHESDKKIVSSLLDLQKKYPKNTDGYHVVPLDVARIVIKASTNLSPQLIQVCLSRHQDVIRMNGPLGKKMVVWKS